MAHQPIQKLIHVEGNIGSGKTTFMYYLQSELKELNIECQREPVDQWTSHKGHNYLKNFYENPSKYIFPLQMHIMRTISDQALNKKPWTTLLVTERSMLSQHHVFVQVARERNMLGEAEYIILNDWHQRTISHIPKPIMIIYLRADPKVCYSRILQRERREEVNYINYDYVTTIHNKYDKWIEEIKNQIPVITVNANSLLHEQFDEYEKIKNTLVKIQND